MKKHVIVPLIAGAFLCANVQAQGQSENEALAFVNKYFDTPLQILNDDERSACEVLLCLAAPTHPEECLPALRRFFSIWDVRPWMIVKKRIDFLMGCPASDEEGMGDFIEVVAKSAGRCDVASLNKNTKIITSGVPVDNPGCVWCADFEKYRDIDREHKVIDDQKPHYCHDLHNHEYTKDLNVRYVGTPANGGKWVKAIDYDKELAKYNERMQGVKPRVEIEIKPMRDYYKETKFDD